MVGYYHNKCFVRFFFIIMPVYLRTCGLCAKNCCLRGDRDVNCGINGSPKKEGNTNISLILYWKRQRAREWRQWFLKLGNF